jgi:two-component system, OmpR family, KDP operon response regulator KdpE
VSAPMKIVLVEDEPELSKFLELFLKAHRHQVWTFGDGAKAAEVLGEIGPDLLLCDLGVPGCDGEAIASAAARLPRPPRIVLMSGQPARLIRMSSVAAFLLPKPFAISELRRAIGE